MAEITDKGLVISHKEVAVLESGVAALLSLLSAPFYIIMYSLVGWVLWGWFITPVLGVPRPILPMLMGLTITIRYVFTSSATATLSSEQETKRKENPVGYWWDDFKLKVAAMLLVLALGYALVNWPTLI